MNYTIIEPYYSEFYVDTLYLKYPQNTVENKIEELIEYCQLITNDKHLFDEFDFEPEQLNIHKRYIIDKLFYLNRIIEYKIQNEIREKYNVLKNVLCDFEINYIVNIEMCKNIHVMISREMLFIMNNNDIWNLN
jgi:hypothetical protein